jgi:ankyrin repeat domain-containing protein 50
MIIAHEDDHFAPVLQATGAIMFMGTPHRGSQLATALSQLAKITNFWLHASYASAIAGSMRTDLIDALSRDSAKLDEINESFKQRAKTMTILSCYERVKLRGSPQLVSSLLCLRMSVVLILCR